MRLLLLKAPLYTRIIRSALCSLISENRCQFLPGFPPQSEIKSRIFPLNLCASPHKLAVRTVQSSLKLERAAVSLEKQNSVGRGVNKRKREAIKSRSVAQELTKLSNREIKNFVRYAGLDEHTLDSINLAKFLGHQAKNGWRRQLNYIGGLLRAVDAELVDLAFEAAKDGDLRKLTSWKAKRAAEGDSTEPDSIESFQNEDEEEEDEENELEEMEAERDILVEQWLTGLKEGDSEISKLIYGMDFPDFDRQALRRLVREVVAVCKKVKDQEIGENETEDSKLTGLVTRKENDLRQSLAAMADFYIEDAERN